MLWFIFVTSLSDKLSLVHFRAQHMLCKCGEWEILKCFFWKQRSSSYSYGVSDVLMATGEKEKVKSSMPWGISGEWKLLGVSSFQVPQVSAQSLPRSLPEWRKNKFKTENTTPWAIWILHSVSGGKIIFK